MAKTGSFVSDPAMVAKSTELKEELRRLVQTILDEDDLNLEAIDQANCMLCTLKDLKLNRPVTLDCPKEFLCPISKELMRDPVVIASGQTYDRPFIQKCLKEGNLICPLTKQVLPHATLTPNHVIRNMITKWCKTKGIQLSDPAQYYNDDGLTDADRDHFLSLLEMMSSTLPIQKVAASELRSLTKMSPSFRALFGESVDAITQLLSPLTCTTSQNDIDPALQEDVITTLLNLSIHENNKAVAAETPMVIPILMDALRSGAIETKSNAAAAFFTLSAIDSNKALIGKSGALKPLVDLLEEGHALPDVSSAIFNLCILPENKVRAVRDGAVRVIVKKIMNRIHVDELVAILALLSSNNQRSVDELGELDAVPCLFSIIRESSSPSTKENCIVILHAICFRDRAKWKEMREEENFHGTVSQLAQNGTSRAKRKANGILERLYRPVNLTHTA